MDEEYFTHLADGLQCYLVKVVDVRKVAHVLAGGGQWVLVDDQTTKLVETKNFELHEKLGVHQNYNTVICDDASTKALTEYLDRVYVLSIDSVDDDLIDHSYGRRER